MKKKNKNLIWYIGFGIAFALILLLFLTDFPENVDTGIMLFTIPILSVSYTMLTFNKMMRDHDFKVEVMDERNIAIKEKAGSVANYATMFLLACATALFVALKYTLPAIVTGVIYVCNPWIIIVITNKIEKKM